LIYLDYLSKVDWGAIVRFVKNILVFFETKYVFVTIVFVEKFAGPSLQLLAHTFP